MRPHADQIILSPSDLGRFLSCKYLTALDLAVVRGQRKKPPLYPDPVLDVLIERGLAHEAAFVEKQGAGGLGIIDLSEGKDRIAQTIAAMREGVDIIVQGQLEQDRWGGKPDILRRIQVPSNLGPWSYEVIDTKLARDTKGATILQLSLYSEMVAAIQGVTPEFFYVVTPECQERYRLSEYASYYRLVKRGLAHAVTVDPMALAAANYPEPVEYCDVCRWEQECKARRRAEDHLSLVAGISRLQRRELEPTGVTTLEALAKMPLPFKAKRGSAATYERVREQARVQLEGRLADTNVHEMLLPITVEAGLALLPEPSPHDVFLDLEGDPFAREDGREYLFGLVTVDVDGTERYHRFWAYTDEEEKAAFEAAIDLIMSAREQDPAQHIYHYAPYEGTAFKRLMGRYATRQDEVDSLLRGGGFVDLHKVVKQSLRASVEKYSIKDMEKFYGFTRSVELRLAGDRRAFVERCLETGALDLIDEETRTIVEGYNHDDCVSTWKLRDWLEILRKQLIDAGTAVPRPAPREREPSEELADYLLRIRARMEQLLAGVPVDSSERKPDEQARWLLAHLLEYHRREKKVSAWNFFHLRELSLDDYEDEPRALIGLEFVERLIVARRGAHTDRYRYPAQDCDIHRRDTLHDGEGELGDVIDQDRGARTIDVKKRQVRADDHPAAVFAHKDPSARPIPEALERIAEAVVDHGLTGGGEFRAAWSLLTNQPPRLRSGAFKRNGGESAVDFAARVVIDLDGTVLPIQGPPGAGKTYAGAQMICELVKTGKSVGVTGPSHAVIEHLLRKVIAVAAAAGLPVTCGAKVSEMDEDERDIRQYKEPAIAINALLAGEVQVLGGTPWLWSAERALGVVDVLVCDEAGQMCLANMVAASGAADSIVLLGDPQQLEQVQQGSHPDGTGVSALEHILGDHATIPDDRGIFLDETWRMHPSICEFCSQVFYESRLRSRVGLEKQELKGTKRFDGSGLWLVGVEHDGNQNDSPQEVEAVEAIVDDLLNPRSSWVNAKGELQPMTAAAILIVSPYNRQVAELQSRLAGRGVQVGTVDRFQGREAAVVIYSTASSTASDSSRGMEFLYNLSRLNVATSRARCATILVASPKLFEPECHSPRQMKLANALCRYVEMAKVVEL